jgi:hypothetical protein
MEDKLFSINAAAAFLGGLSPWTIRRYLTLGLLQRTKVGGRTMIWESELRRLIHDETPQEAARRNSAAEIVRNARKLRSAPTATK